MDSDSRCRRLRAAGAGALIVTLSAWLGACGGSEKPQSANERAGDYPVDVLESSFPARQRLAQTSRLTLKLRNAGEKRIPALVVSVHVAGVEGEQSVQPFSVRDPQPDLALPARPVWILEEGFPRVANTTRGANAETSDQRTFDFGPLAAGETTEAIWKATAVRAGDFRLRYRVEAGLGGKAKAVGPGGEPVGGAFGVRISPAPPQQRVNSKGEVVIIRP